MERILIPTDFSTAAGNAANYALLFFKGKPCTFQLLNTYVPDFINSRVMSMSPFSVMESDPMQLHSESGLQHSVNLLEDLNIHSGFSFETVSSFSLLSEEIRNLCESGGVDLIVSGTRGATGAQEIFLGTNTVRILKAAGTCPVLVIPAEASPKIPERIGFATDYNQPFSGEQLDQLHFFTSRHKSQFFIFHVGTKKALTPLQEMHKRQLELELDLLHPNFEWLAPLRTISESIQQAVSQYKLDLLILIRNEYSFPDNWFRDPVVKRMVFHTSKPLLVLPNIQN
ncbi:MAG: hypothetical protein RLZZ241_236 [Bacteroidota bacterium]|jgi:nucleotide-binding universal stress UspA family protein